MVTNTQATDTDALITLSFNLSIEQLTIVLRMLDIPRLAGFLPLKTMSEEVMGAVTRSLIAQETLLINDQNDLVLNPVIQNIVMTGLTAIQYLNVTQIDAEGRDEYWFYMQPDTPIVSHYQPIEGVHRFETLPTSVLIGESMLNIIEIDIADKSKYKADPISIPTMIFEKAYEAALDQNLDDMDVALRQTDVPEIVKFVMVQPQSRTICTFGSSYQEMNKHASLLALKVDKGFWAIQIEEETTYIHPLSHEEFVIAIADLLVATVPDALQ